MSGNLLQEAATRVLRTPAPQRAWGCHPDFPAVLSRPRLSSPQQARLRVAFRTCKQTLPAELPSAISPEQSVVPVGTPPPCSVTSLSLQDLGACLSPRAQSTQRSRSRSGGTRSRQTSREDTLRDRSLRHPGRATAGRPQSPRQGDEEAAQDGLPRRLQALTVTDTVLATSCPE